MKTRLAGLLAAVSAVVATTSFAQNLIQNGSFEVNNSYTGWTFTGALMVVGGPGAGTQCADGFNAVGLSWQSTIYQNVPTEIGRRYRLSFYMACWGPDRVPSNTVNLIISANSSALGAVSFDGTGKTYQNMGWRKSEYLITAAATTTRITFSNPAAPLSTGMPMIDDVRLVADDSIQIVGGKVAAWGNNSSGQLFLPSGLKNVKQIAAGAFHSLTLKSDGTVIGWGSNSFGEANPPNGLSNVLAIAAGGQHSLALRADGTVTAWGNNANGQTNVPPYLSNVIQISAGARHNLALRSDGTVIGWGGGIKGEGYVRPDLLNVKAVAAGIDASLALKRDGTVVAWGDNTYGQINVPVGLSNVVAIASGKYQSLALKGDGTVAAWGIGYDGRTNLPSGLSNVIAVSVGGSQSLALKSDGRLVAWGLNSYNLTNIPAGLSNVSGIAAGGSHNLAIVQDGPPEILVQPSDLGVRYQSNFVLTVSASGLAPLSYQWRFKNFNVLDSSRVSGSQTALLTVSNAQFTDAGNYRVVVSNALGVVQSEEATVTVISPPIITRQPVGRAVTAGTNVSLSVAASGTPLIHYQWLLNGAAIPGRTNTELNLTNIQSVNAGTYSVLASNAYGVTASSNAVVSVTETAPYIVVQPTNLSLRIGESATFSVKALGTEPMHYQWQHDGKNIFGATNSSLALTDLDFDDEGFYGVAISNSVGVTVSVKGFLAVSRLTIWGTQVPSALAHFPVGLSNVVALSAGSSHILALKSDGTIKSWGSRTIREFKGGSFTNVSFVETNNPATTVPPDLHDVVAVSAGDLHSLALKSNGTVVAWGDNTYGQTNVPLNLSNVVAIAAGGNNSLALRADDTVVAWGNESTVPRLISIPLTNVPPGLSNVTAIAAGLSHGVALKNNGRVVTWGAGTNVPSNFSNFVAVVVGKGSSSSSPYFSSGKPDDYLALRADGTVVSWTDRAVPIGFAEVVSGLSNVVAIDQGKLSLMALRMDGSVYVSLTTNKPPQGLSNVVAIAAGGGARSSSPFTIPGSTPEFFVAAVGNGSPAFTIQPASQRAVRGGQIQLHARAVGVQPLQFQWQLNGTNIPGATNGTLTILNFQPDDIGEYRAIASNALGVATSKVANVSLPVPSLAHALNADSFSWSTSASSANANWFSQLIETHDGEAAAQSGSISHDEFSGLQTTVIGPGTIRFWWKTSSEFGYDFLEFFLGETNVPQASISGETDWQQLTLTIPPGSHVLKWIFSKDDSVSAGADAGWLDEVSFTPAAPPAELQFFAPQILDDGSLLMSVARTDGGTVSSNDLGGLELQTSSNLVEWFPLTNGECTTTLSNGVFLIQDASKTNWPTRFYRVIHR